MSFDRQLQIIAKEYRVKQSISDCQRHKLYHIIINDLKEEDAKTIYKDLCYIYICTSNEEVPSVENLTLLTHKYDPHFIKSLLDVGNLIDRLADACVMNVADRKRKYSEKDIEQKQKGKIQRQASEFNAKWSEYLFKSRAQNLQAYLLVYHKLITQSFPYSDWRNIIVDNDIKQRPPSYFMNIQTKDLTILEKKALIHKLNAIYQHIPRQTRERLQMLIEDVYNNTYINTNINTIDPTEIQIIDSIGLNNSCNTGKNCCIIM